MFIFLLLTNKYTNPYKLIMIFGKKGSGKSTTLTKYAIQHVRKGWTVYSTERIPYTYYIRSDDIGRVMLEDFNYVPFDKDNYKGLTKILKVLREKIKPTAPKILLLIDEVGMIWDNRNFKNFRPEVRDWFKLQRHYHTKVVMFSQTFDVDKKLRDLTDSMYLQRNFARVFTIGKKIKKFISINNNGDDGGKLDEYFDFEPAIFFFLVPGLLLLFLNGLSISIHLKLLSFSILNMNRQYINVMNFPNFLRLMSRSLILPMRGRRIRLVQPEGC